MYAQGAYGQQQAVYAQGQGGYPVKPEMGYPQQQYHQQQYGQPQYGQPVGYGAQPMVVNQYGQPMGPAYGAQPMMYQQQQQQGGMSTGMAVGAGVLGGMLLADAFDGGDGGGDW